MCVKKHNVSCKWLKLATWGKERREIFFKYKFFSVFFLTWKHTTYAKKLFKKLALDLEKLGGRGSWFERSPPNPAPWKSDRQEQRMSWGPKERTGAPKWASLALGNKLTFSIVICSLWVVCSFGDLFGRISNFTEIYQNGLIYFRKKRIIFKSKTIKIKICYC